MAVNLAYTLAQMGAKVGIFDADVYGPSLPTMVSPELTVLQMNAETREITPTEYEGIKLVSFGYAGQGNTSIDFYLLRRFYRQCNHERVHGVWSDSTAFVSDKLGYGMSGFALERMGL